MSLADTRHHQMFPELDTAQLAITRRFASGPPRRFEAGEMVFDVGDAQAPVWVVLEGAIEVVRRDGLGNEKPITLHTPGQFTGEVSQLAGRASLAAGRAGEHGCLALPFDTAHLRALMISSAEVGEVVMRALILRRVGLIEGDASGSVLIGEPDDPHLTRLQGFLTRNGYPNTVMDVSDEDGRALVERLGIQEQDLPVMVCPSGRVLRQPSDAEAAHCLGMTPDIDPDHRYDVAIVGAGPAGLATAVYAASEGLSVIVLDQRAIGGQAGASARIENYLGFPTGISGQALAGRAYNQALKFGAELAIPLEAATLECGREDGALRLDLADGKQLQASTVVIASGARYRRPQIDQLDRFEGHGVSYWASPVEARLCEGGVVALVGGGNSAGQAVAFLAPRVKELHLIIRGEGLEASMSQYLIERIAALPNVTLHTGTEVAALEGDPERGLQAAVLRTRADGQTQRLELRHLFLFVGADPNTGWLQQCVETDAHGFVVTGSVRAEGLPPCLPLETNRRGVFAIGDVRAGSVKRVAAAVGEGAAVVAQIHQFLAHQATPVAVSELANATQESATS
ncbi:FAD-dependent oxidoreductase [Xanthomonas campestris pv. campestris]|uniref:FAD-dependent oxidoreductase n=1 Tax=Xanthomonas campestris TaxID=339 RepID=UPI002368EA04|nr:FAD-dependent oxidoreductase [Xanthomonas campestris]MDM7675972.1 FAD-dependent oxidoreductase [Xanthomonas campestris pv. campestris]MDM7679063.1 FAD-dependent oxidoreductase [Xanthomonas campestris pv. campestris]MDM7699950.1 FAD-dependent oxidoreductase [Xanthomonas campestris pv. campestris]MDM7721624.1 FAD-dependent oxidoreductase [Xanthomonas campestris pv. campestris]MEA0940019.1 FAD-dependent oxidoreductase [Xanthomonas campestris pv. campestris]